MKRIFMMALGYLLIALFFPFKKMMGNRQKRLIESYIKDPQSISDQEAHVILKDLAWEEYKRGNFQKAKTYSHELLRLNDLVDANWNHGNAIHHSHSIIGLVSLESNDIAEAKKQLLLSSKTSGSPQLASFGPTFLLAQKLLDLDEYAPVKKYLINCRQFWEMDKGRISKWLEQINAGEKPQFQTGENT